MRWQTTALLAVLLVALGTFYYVWEVRLGPERERAEARKGRLWTAEPADVTEVEIKRPGDTLRLRRDADQWRMLAPVQARGDRGRIEDALTTLVTAKIDREIDAAPAALGEFGLDQPAAAVTLTLKDGRRLAVELGSKNPTGLWVYAKEPDKPAVFVLPDGVLRDATRPASDFRDRTILAFDRRAVSGLEIGLREETLSLAWDDHGWRLTRPRALPADADTINDLLDKLQSARVKEFVAEAPRSREPYGLDRPVRLVVYTGKDKDRTSRTLLLGKVDAAKQGVYAMREGEESVLLLPQEIWNQVPKNVAAARDKTVVAFERDKVTRVDVESPRGAVTLTREADRWRITQPTPLPADPVEAGALLSALKNLKAQAFLSEDASGIARWLGHPEVKVTITEQGAAAPRILLLAPSPERRGGQPSAYAAVAGQGPVVLVEAKALTDLGKSVNDLRDRTLVSGLEPRDVKRVQVTRGDKRVLVERKGDDEWRLLEPTKGAARRAKVDDVVYGVRGLKWKEIVAPGGEDAARYGLDKPEAVVTLYRADGGEIVTLEVGRQEGNRRFVRTRGAPTIYAIDARLFELPAVPDDFAG
jgi:hypothetical protein